MGLGLVIGSTLARRVVGLAAAMDAIGQGQLDAAVPEAKARDEIGAMTRTLARLQVHLLTAEAAQAEQVMAQAARSTRAAQLEQLMGSFSETAGHSIDEVLAASGELDRTATDMTELSGRSRLRTVAMAERAAEANANVAAVADAAGMLSGAIVEITGLTSRAASIASEASDDVKRTDALVHDLSGSARTIEDVVTLINTIAKQTNMLALNAMIEAARAGPAGLGFAVVATEVKALATQTAGATKDIGDQVSAMQRDTAAVVDAIKSIGGTIANVVGICASIAAAVEEQESSTREIADNVARAADGTRFVSDTAAQIEGDAVATERAAGGVLQTATRFTEQADIINGSIRQFLTDAKAA